MTVEEIFTRLSAHMEKGITIHQEISNMYNFLNLCGYGKCHEYHYYDEIISYRCLQNYYFKHYNKLILKEENKQLSLIPNTWYKYTSMEVDNGTKRSSVQDLMKEWIKWETETKQLLQESYKELYELGEICSAIKIAKFLEDVDEELNTAKKKQMMLDSVSYDISFIMKEQKEYYEKYKKKISKLCIK